VKPYIVFAGATSAWAEYSQYTWIFCPNQPTAYLPTDPSSKLLGAINAARLQGALPPVVMRAERRGAFGRTRVAEASESSLSNAVEALRFWLKLLVDPEGVECF